MNASHACLTTHAKLANTYSLYLKEKMETKNNSFAQDVQKALDLFCSADIIGKIH